MNLGVIGLGRMGGAIAYRAQRVGFQVVGYDIVPAHQEDARVDGIVIVESIQQLVQSVDVIWLMVPAGSVVDHVLDELLRYAREGLIVIDGGNSKFADSRTRAARCAQQSVQFIDCGTSGGVAGREHGFCLMIGGARTVYDQLIDLWHALAAPNGFGYMGPSGAGHYVKMIHNGIEYALMQSYAEGFDLLKHGTYPDMDLAEISRVWSHGSVIRSWLLELCHDIFTEDQTLHTVSGRVTHSGMGKWTVENAHEHNVPVTLIEQSLAIRDQSQMNGGRYATKVLALLRNKFGGHAFEHTQKNKKS